MKNILLLTFVLISSVVYSQELRLLRGAITENLAVNDTVNETYSLYLPSNFEINRPWPVAFVMDLKGKGKAAVSMLINAAEQEGYVLAACWVAGFTDWYFALAVLLLLPVSILLSKLFAVT